LRPVDRFDGVEEKQKKEREKERERERERGVYSSCCFGYGWHATGRRFNPSNPILFLLFIARD